MSALGLAMFAIALIAMVASGLPVYAVLLGVSALFTALGVALGAFDLALLGALPNRVVGLLEHDLLQALPLYALIGALLNRLPLAALLHRAGERVFARSAAASELSALGVGALLAPMNGSVGASLHTLSRSVAPELEQRGTSAERSAATVCVASTLGVVIPPSLVLLLLGDAMMRAHTEALNATRAALRIVNTQDVMRAALVPGLIVLLIACGIAAWRGRGAAARAFAPLPHRQALIAAVVALVIAVLLGGVAVGRLYAVEAAATGGVTLWIAATLSGHLDTQRMRLVLRDTMALTGALFALLVAATTFSLVLRAFGTDTLIAHGLHALSDHPRLLLLCVLAGLVACSFVLDAFEMIFLVIPLVMPPVLMTVDDAAWVAALTLLVLQLGFLLPPFGYALVMSRSLLATRVGVRALARALWPQLGAQALLIVAVLAFPQITQWARPSEAASSTQDAGEAERLMQEAIKAQQRDAGEH
ncbi:MAG: TRAP transporter large permease subunit [Betaproteobacteria bacterium]|nr:MAG: TRAP transporter large permease subunit [Betaproteobacteria bacterium]